MFLKEAFALFSASYQDEESSLKKSFYFLLNELLLLRLLQEELPVSPVHLKERAAFFYPPLADKNFFQHDKISSGTLQKIYLLFLQTSIKDSQTLVQNLYEKTASRQEKKKFGQFYTSPEIIKYILSAVKYTSRFPIEEIAVLDPACGTGNFLVEALKVLKKKLKHLPPEEIIKKITENIYGFEINSFTCALTEFNLLFECLDLITQAKKTDPSYLPQAFKIYPIDAIRNLPEPDKKFDAVIGNPPYLSSYSRYSIKLSTQEKEELRHLYSVSSRRINTYFLFLLRAVSCLSEHGYLGFILPKSLLATRTYQEIRRNILKQVKIVEIVNLGENIFSEAVVPSIILILQKEEEQTKREKNKVTVKFSLNEKKTKKINQKNFTKLMAGSFNIYLESKTLKILRKLEKESVPLKEIASVYDGINPGPFRHLLLRQTKTDEKDKLLIEGRNIQSFFIKWTGKFIHFAPELIKELQPDYPNSLAILGKEERFTKEKIVTRQTSHRIIAAYDNKHYYFTNSVHGITLKNNSLSLKYLLAFLNSNLLNYYYSLVFKEKEDIFPQIKIRNLRQLPVRLVLPAEQSEVITYIEEVLKIENTPEREVFVQKTLKQLNTYFYNLHNLTVDEIDLVETMSTKKIA